MFTCLTAFRALLVTPTDTLYALIMNPFKLMMKLLQLMKLKLPMEMMWPPHIIFVMFSDRPVGADDVCTGPKNLDQPDEVTAATLFEELSP